MAPSALLWATLLVLPALLTSAAAAAVATDAAPAENPRKLLHTRGRMLPDVRTSAACTLKSVQTSIRKLTPWTDGLSGPQQWLLELNITNFCDAPVTYLRFSNCEPLFFNGGPYEGLYAQIPTSQRQWCQQGKALAMVAGTQDVCQATANFGNCDVSSTIYQVPAATSATVPGRTTLYYVQLLRNFPPLCNLEVKYGTGSTLVWQRQNTANTYCTTTMLDFTSQLPTNYTCNVGPQYPGLIYCPPV